AGGVVDPARREDVKADKQERDYAGDALQGVLVVALVWVVVGLRGGRNDQSINRMVENRNPQDERFDRDLKRNSARELGFLPPHRAALEDEGVFEEVEK